MRIRYFLLETPDYQFHPKGLFPLIDRLESDFTSAYPLANEDMMCTLDDAGNARMQIMVSWWQVPLTVWCDDKEGLHAALARFWGNREE
jgi:hypothetical protein